MTAPLQPLGAGFSATGDSRNAILESQSIPKLALSCKTLLRHLQTALDRDPCSLAHFLPLQDIRHVQERYEQWAGNLGALQSSNVPSSLEHRLIDAPIVRTSILRTLLTLESSIVAGRLHRRGSMNQPTDRWKLPL